MREGVIRHESQCARATELSARISAVDVGDGDGQDHR